MYLVDKSDKVAIRLSHKPDTIGVTNLVTAFKGVLYV